MASDANPGESTGMLGNRLDEFFRAGPEPEPAPAPAPAQEPTVATPVAAEEPEGDPSEVPTTRRARRVQGRLRARKVRRLVRHVEPWSVLKLSLIFNVCLWVIFMVAGVIMWSFAEQSNTLDNVENFVEELFALESFQFDGQQIFERAALGGLVLVVGLTGFAVLLAVLFNLISDLTGGLRLTVIEEETARVFVRGGSRPADATDVATVVPPSDAPPG